MKVYNKRLAWNNHWAVMMIAQGVGFAVFLREEKTMSCYVW